MKTRIFVFDEQGGHAHTVESDDVAAHLAAIGMEYERWAVRPLAADAEQAAVLSAYGEEVQRLSNKYGYRSVDVVRIHPEAPHRAEARAKFLAEHIHEDDETRFFVEGSGIFYVRANAQVHAIFCTAGDLLRVPAGVTHWFDMGTAPMFCAIRLFTTPNGWEAKFTGDPISTRIPPYDALATA